MYNICTLSDYNFLVQGLSLYESLLAFNPNIKLHYLCLDKKTFDKLKDLNLNNLEPYLIDNLLLDDEFKKLEDSTNPELGGNNRNEFIWSLASFFMWYLMCKLDTTITYIDSDIQFYSDISLIFNRMENKDVCLFRHKHIITDCVDGFFNVGVVVFKNTDNGKKALKWWRDAVYTREPKSLNTCGDQKFLEGIFTIIDPNSIYIGDKDIGHGAPWHYRFFNYDNLFVDNTIVWGDKRYTFLFNHFSKFKYYFDDKSFSYTGNHYKDHTLNGGLFVLPQLQKLYMDYFKNLIEINKKYNL